MFIFPAVLSKIPSMSRALNTENCIQIAWWEVRKRDVVPYLVLGHVWPFSQGTGVLKCVCTVHSLASSCFRVYVAFMQQLVLPEQSPSCCCLWLPCASVHRSNYPVTVTVTVWLGIHFKTQPKDCSTRKERSHGHGHGTFVLATKTEGKKQTKPWSQVRVYSFHATRRLAWLYSCCWRLEFRYIKSFAFHLAGQRRTIPKFAVQNNAFGENFISDVNVSERENRFALLAVGQFKLQAQSTLV